MPRARHLYVLRYIPGQQTPGHAVHGNVAIHFARQQLEGCLFHLCSGKGALASAPEPGLLPSVEPLLHGRLSAASSCPLPTLCAAAQGLVHCAAPSTAGRLAQAPSAALLCAEAASPPRLRSASSASAVPCASGSHSSWPVKEPTAASSGRDTTLTRGILGLVYCCHGRSSHNPIFTQ